MRFLCLSHVRIRKSKNLIRYTRIYPRFTIANLVKSYFLNLCLVKKKKVVLRIHFCLETRS